jgi:hypothetical protein
MKLILAGAAAAAVMFGSVAFAASTTPAASTPAATTASTPAPAADAAPAASDQPPASLHCKAPKVPTAVKGKNGKTTWKCKKPAAAPAPATH